MSYKNKLQENKLSPQQTIKVGDLIKPKWASASSLKKENKEWSIPPMGIITEIYYAEKVKEHMAIIDWQKANVPEIKAETSDYEFQRYCKFYTHISVENLTLYEPYIKSFTVRNKRKLYSK